MFKAFINAVKLFNEAFKNYRLRILVIFFLSLANSFLEGIGISTIVPILSMASGQPHSTDLISRTIEAFFNIFSITYTLSSLLIFIGILFIMKAVVLFFVNYIVANIVANYQKETREELFSRTLKANWKYLSHQKVGHLDQMLTTNVNTISSLFPCISTLMIVATKLLIYIIIAINISPIVVGLAMILSAFTFFALKPFFSKNKKITAAAESFYRQLAHFTNESIIGMKTVKSLFAESPVFKKGEEYFSQVKKINVDLVLVRGVADIIMQFAGIGFIFVMFAFFYKMTDFNLGAFAVMVFAVNQIFSQVQGAQAQFHGVISVVPYLTSVLNYIGELKNHEEGDGGEKEFSFGKELSFDNVSFSYKEEREVLKRVSFSFGKGQMTGLIGPSGSGKTTIVDLLLRLYKPQSGKILLDGNDISGIKMKKWRNSVGYVSQDMFLLNDTIENNIKFYSDSVSHKEVVRAAKMANIHEFIEDLPEKFETMVGERGILLSGGQRQRIVLARVLARNPEILILDEATSALDNESEALIQKAIEGLRGHITVLAIAHRLSTVKASDKLIVLDKGEIVEQGTPEKLLEDKNSYFYKISNIKN
ncbi:MAG: ABC transporter ATP-binding protein [Candidatus Pacebacteria bacterium]|nr:ABC transporter ATP-binding protein [Candidatus Paceibacterota bacterium]